MLTLNAGCASPGQPSSRTIDTTGSVARRRAAASRMARAGRYDQAIKQYTALLAEPGLDRGIEAHSQYELGRAHGNRGGRVGGKDPTPETLEADREAAIRHTSDALASAETLGEGGPPGLRGRAGRSLSRFLGASGRSDEAIEVCQGLLAQMTDPDVERLRTLHELGIALHERGGPTDLDQAFARQSEALELAERLEDCPPALTGQVHNALGFVHSARSEFGQAVERFSAAEPILREHGKPGQHAQVLSNLILALAETGQYGRLRTRYAELRNLPEATTSPPTMAVVGMAALHLGDFAEAQEQFDLARYLARRDPNYSRDINLLVELTTNAAVCAQAVGAYDEAEAGLIEVAKELEAGGVDPRTAAVIKANLGRMYLTLERLDEAEAQLDAVLKVFRELSGPENTDTLGVELDLVNLTRSRGFLVDAQFQCAGLLDRIVTAHGESHPLVARVRLELAALLRGQEGRCPEALAQAKQAVAAFDAQLGPDHKHSVIACLQAALIATDCSAEAGNGDESRELQTEARNRFRRLRAELGPANVEVLRATVYSADLSARTPAAYAQALATYRRAEEGFGELYGDGALSLADLRLKQATLLKKMGRLDEALRTCERARRYLDRSLGDHPAAARLLETIGDIHEANGQAEQALAAYRAALQILTPAYGRADPRVQRLRQKIEGAQR